MERANKFARGDWLELMQDRPTSIQSSAKEHSQEEEQRRRGQAACNRVKHGQVSRARQELVGATLAPKTLETLAELQGRRPQERVREIPPEVLASHPRPVDLDSFLFAKCLASAPSGSAPGPGGCTFEMLKVCLEDAETLHLLFRAAEDLARAEAPEPITRAFMSATMTALLKHDGGVRGIATGTSFRRLVAKTMARQFGKAVEAACAPFQFALSTRAGTDCVGHAVRAMTDANPECTVLSIDGVGAYDHVLRSSFLSKLHSVPSLQGLLPFVRSIYAQTTTYVWEDGTGVRHRIQQAEGGEQGDPLMPLLFSLGIHDSLCEVRNRLRPDDTLFAYLDDVYVSSPPNRTRDGYNLLEQQLSNSTRAKRECGVAPREWKIWARTSGAQMASRSGHATFASLCTASKKGDWKMRGSWEAVTWEISKARADSSAVCWAHVATTCFAHCPRVIPQSMLPATTTACGRPRGRFWEDSRARRKIR